MTRVDDSQYHPLPSVAEPVATAASHEPLSYADWIAAYVARHNGMVVALCGAATEDMVAAFPELRRVRGHFGGHAHWWCETPDGEIVDPTVSQFAHRTPEWTYVEYVGADPIGKCMACGEYVWENIGAGGDACSIECYNDLADDYGMPRMRQPESATTQNAVATPSRDTRASVVAADSSPALKIDVS